MTLSHDELRRVVATFDEIDEGQVRRVRDHDAFAISIEFYLGEGFRRLLIATRADEARLHYTEERGEARPAGHPSAFLMACRKHLDGARLVNARVHGRDRVVTLEFDRDEVRRYLIFECTGHHPNLFLTDDKRLILARLAPTHSRKRVLEPGRPYQHPVEPEKANSLHQVGLVRFLGAGDALHREIEAHYLVLEEARRFEEQVREVRRVRGARLDHVVRKRAKVAEDLARAEEAMARARGADALKAHLHTLIEVKGRESVTLPWQGEEIELPLDPALTLRGNLEALYRKARKYGEMADFVRDRLAKVSAEEDALRQDAATLEQARRARAHDVVEAMAGKYQAEDGAPGTLPAAGARPRRDAPREPYRSFTASTGAAILVGRNRRDNEVLSLRIANGRDLWFHARDFEGAHVVLRVDRNRAPDPTAIDDAALLAAWFSQGNREGAVDVTITEAKHLRAAKDAPVGSVTVAKGRTIRVRIDQERLTRLLPERAEAPPPRPARPPARRTRLT